MSKGMWTKHFSMEGKVYYYNAALQKSQWSPPQDSVVHEAINAKWSPPKIESEGDGEVEEGQIKSTDIAPTPSQMPMPPGYPMQMPPFPPLPPGFPAMMHMMPPNGMPPMPFPPNMPVGMPPMFMPENLPSAAFLQHENHPTATPSSGSTNPPLTEAEIQTMKNQQAALDIQAKIDQALQQKQREITTSKRFKKANPEDDGNQQQSTYLKQKSDLENMSGSKSDDSSKWFVR